MLTTARYRFTKRGEAEGEVAWAVVAICTFLSIYMTRKPRRERLLREKMFAIKFIMEIFIPTIRDRRREQRNVAPRFSRELNLLNN